MSKGGVSPSGRALRFVLWRLPLRATQLALARNSAAASEHGRYVLALAGFGFWVAVFWYAASWWHQATGMVVPLQVAGLLGLLLIWRIIGYLRRLWVNRHNLVSMAVTQQRQREMHQVITKTLPGQMQQWGQQVTARVGDGEGGFTVMGSLRREDETYQQVRRTRRDQLRQVRDMLPEEQRGMPLGDQFEPLIRWPWRRRRGPK